MFKRISIFLIVLLTILCFVGGASAVDPGLFVEKDEDNTYIDYVDADGTSIMKIDDTDGVTVAVLTAGTTTTVTSYTSMTITSTTDASSLTTGSVTTAGGMSVGKQLYIGDDLDMSQTAVTGTYDITLLTNMADALSIVDTAPGDLIVFCTTTGAQKVTITPATTITGLLTASGGITVGVSDDGETVTFYGDNANSDFVWAEDGDTNVGSLTLGATTDYVDFIAYGATATTYIHWDGSGDDLLLVGTATTFQVAGTTDTSLTTNSIVTAGGIACTKQLWLGDDLDMSTSATGVYEITLRDSVDDALSIVAGVDLMLFDTDTDQITFTPEILLKDDIDMTTSTTGVYDLTLKDAQADALSIVGGSTDMVVFCTDTDSITFAPQVTFSGFVDIGVFGTGIAVTAGTHAFEVHTEPGSAHTAHTSTFGVRSRYEISVAQTNIVTIEAVDARLRVKHALAGGIHCGLQATIEASGTSADFSGTSGSTMNAAGSFTLDFDSSVEIADGIWTCGVSIDSAVDGAVSMTSTEFVALRISVGTGGGGKEVWEYGIYMGDDDAVIGMQIGDCTTALNLEGDTGTAGILLSGAATADHISITGLWGPGLTVSAISIGDYSTALALNAGSATTDHTLGMVIHLSGDLGADDNVIPLLVKFTTTADADALAICQNIYTNVNVLHTLSDAYAVRANMNISPAAGETLNLMLAIYAQLTIDDAAVTIESMASAGYFDVNISAVVTTGQVTGVDIDLNGVQVDNASLVTGLLVHCEAAAYVDYGIDIMLAPKQGYMTAAQRIGITQGAGSCTVAKGLQIYVYTAAAQEFTVGISLEDGATVTGIDVGSCTTGIAFTGTVTGSAISMASITLADGDHEIQMRTTVGMEKTIIASGSGTSDAEIVTDVGADASIADGSLYMECTDGGGALWIKENDIWVEFTSP